MWPKSTSLSEDIRSLRNLFSGAERDNLRQRFLDDILL